MDTRRIVPVGLFVLSLVAVAGFIVAQTTLTSRRSGTERAPDVTQTLPQRWNVGELLWPGAFQPTMEGQLTTVPFAARGKQYVAEVRSDGFAVTSSAPGAGVVSVAFAGSHADRVAALSGAGSAPLRIFSKSSGATSVTPLERYQGATYPNAYPGIDAVYRADASSGELELDFAVRAGADPAAIQLVATQGTRFEPEPGSGDIVAANQHTRYRLRKPVAFQWTAGVRTEVAVHFALAANTLRFELGEYDHGRELVIDPLVASYSTFVGTVTDAFYDTVNAIATDASGNVYLAGVTQFDVQLPVETGFPTTPGSLHLPNPRSPGNDCAFRCGYILKLDVNHQVVYGALLFGLEMTALAVDANGSTYATGHTFGTDFPATSGVFANDPAGQVFAIKLNPDGSALGYAALFAGVLGRAIAVDAQGNAYITGEVDAPGLPTTPGSLKPTYQATGDRINVDAFLLKINPDATALIYGTYLGGTGADTAYGITLVGDGSALVVGRSSSTDFVGFPGANAGLGDAFVMRVAADGSAIVNGRYLGGSGDEYAAAISHDGQDGYLVSGATESSDFPVTSGVLQQRLLGSRNGWVARFDADLGVRYTTYFGGSFIDGLLAVTADANANAYVAGVTFSADMPTTPNGLQDASSAFTATLLAGMGTRFYPISHDAVREAFFAVLNADGTHLEYGTYLGGYYTKPRDFDPLTFGSSIARAINGAIYVGGSTGTESFPTLSGGLSTGMKGNEDGFLVQFVSQDLAVISPTLLPAARIGETYDYQLEVTGGAAPYRWEVAGFALPDGLHLNADGHITGVAANTQTEHWGYQFSVRVTDLVGRTASKSLFVNLHYPGNAYCTPEACTMSVLLGQSFIYDPPYLARGVPPFRLFVSGMLPPGISLDPSTAQLTGTPTTAGTYSLSMRMVDALGKDGAIDWQVEVKDPNPPPPPPPAPPSSGNGGGTSSGGGGGAVTSADLLVLLLLLGAVRVGRRRFAAKRLLGVISTFPPRIAMAANLLDRWSKVEHCYAKHHETNNHHTLLQMR
jgi:hypothetical protein